MGGSREKSYSLKLPRYQAMELLLGAGADPTQGDANGDTPLHICVRQGDLSGLWLLLVEMEDVAPSLQSQNHAGMTVIQEADGWGPDAGITVRLASWWSRSTRRYIMSWLYWD